MSDIILVAETGSDITPEIAKEYGIHLVSMHVQMGEETFDDGTFPVENICEYYEKTGKTPKTSGCSPDDFMNAFDEIHEEYPDKKILYLAYSAVTTCSYQSAIIASEDRDYVVAVDTKQVSVGQAAAVIEVAKFLKEHPEVTIEEAAEKAREISKTVHMCFIPENLDYLSAGGRVSNAAALLGNILSLHPCIEIEDGYLLAKKKYRGSMSKSIKKLVREFAQQHNLKKDHAYLIWATGLSDESKKLAEEAAKEYGFEEITWMQTGCVITCHGGPGAFGLVGLSEV